jgi:hypothetical protein
LKKENKKHKITYYYLIHRLNELLIQEENLLFFGVIFVILMICSGLIFIIALLRSDYTFSIASGIAFLLGIVVLFLWLERMYEP